MRELQNHEEYFESFTRDLNKVAKMEPKQKYLYPIMRSVAFQDFHTALLAVLENPENNTRKEA